ncbi:MAG: hypothetical protein HYS13_06835 [Planctomycetia bacterium]|nr:hypothetical protein [Planctomycetia bacterium]
MTHRSRSFQRKVIYLILMAALLLPISWLGMPGERKAKQPSGAAGQQAEPPLLTTLTHQLSRPRVLARLQQERGFSRADLGDIDAGSETVKLFTLGLHGPACTILWERSRYYQKVESWSKLAATVDQIRKLQPHFILVWRFQGWNLSYNVSVEWDDYKERYYWVVEGIRFIDEGQKYNVDTRLIWDEGWFTAYKIGKSDEQRQFRVLFRDPPKREEEDSLPKLPHAVAERDNWLHGRASFVEILDLIDAGVTPRGQSQVIMASEPAKCTIRYISAKSEEDRDFLANSAGVWWGDALTEWEKVTQRKIRSYVLDEDVYLKDVAKYEDDRNQAAAKLDALLPGKREALLQAKMSQIDPAELKVWEKRDQPNLTPGEQQIIFRLTPLLAVNDADVLQAIVAERPDLRERADAMAVELVRIENRLSAVRHQLQTINYDYWRDRCEAEASELGREARLKLLAAHDKYRQDPATAKAPYEEAFAVWRKLLDKYKSFVQDGEIGDELIREMRRYEVALEKSVAPWPNDFPLQDVIDARKPFPPIPKTGVRTTIDSPPPAIGPLPPPRAPGT